jgi:hypothetical protein
MLRPDSVRFSGYSTVGPGGKYRARISSRFLDQGRERRQRQIRPFEPIGDEMRGAKSAGRAEACSTCKNPLELGFRKFNRFKALTAVAAFLPAISTDVADLFAVARALMAAVDVNSMPRSKREDNDIRQRRAEPALAATIRRTEDNHTLRSGALSRLDAAHG